ncbi:hypothetical protein [Tateyamaria sp. SN3-11]|uniref:hypothetical protein n=1 Tax=Tateyamaria sp. SN3-11 TaxID=3092147 RepID=UPI0039E83E3B
MKDVILAVSIGLGACSTVVPGTLLEMQAIDPLSADPADIALRVDLPDSVALLPQAGTLDLRAQHRDGSNLAGSFPIVAVGDVVQVAPASHAELRALQARISAWNTADPDGTKGSLSVGIAPCLTGDQMPETDRFSVAIQLKSGGPFLPLITGASVADALKGQAGDGVTRCS